MLTNLQVCRCKSISTLSLALNYNFTEPLPPTNLSAVVQCKQGYEIQIDWKVKYDRKQLLHLHTLSF